jgi:hypothetical protein
VNVTTEIEIIYPDLRCSSEEDVFFQRLSEITGVLKVTIRDMTIFVSISSEFKDKALEQVVAICNMWHTTYKLASA